MDENTSDFLFNVSMVMLFIAAISLFMLLYPKSVRNLKLLTEELSRDPDVYAVLDREEDSHLVTGAEIIGNLFKGLEADIDVNGDYFLKDDFQKDNFSSDDFFSRSDNFWYYERLDYIGINPDDMYRVDIERGPDGEILTMVYTPEY